MGKIKGWKKYWESKIDNWIIYRGKYNREVEVIYSDRDKEWFFVVENRVISSHKTKSLALKKAKRYMRSHPDG